MVSLRILDAQNFYDTPFSAPNFKIPAQTMNMDAFKISKQPISMYNSYGRDLEISILVIKVTN